MPVIKSISKLKKWWSKSKKQEYDLNSLDGDRTELRRSTSEQSIDSSEGSYQSADEDVFDSDQNIPERSRSEGTLHKLKHSILNKYKGPHSQSDLGTPKHKTIRKFKSETEILKKQKKNRRSRSVVKSLLCAIPEARDLDSDTDIKQAQNTACNNSRHSFSDSSSLHYLSNTLSPEINLKLDSSYSKQHEEEKSCVPISKERADSKVNTEESVPVPQLNKDEPNTTQTPHLNDCSNDWEAKGARPKEFSTKRNSATSSGISSMEDCLAQQSKDKSVEEYVRSTLPYTQEGHSASCEYNLTCL